MLFDVTGNACTMVADLAWREPIELVGPRHGTKCDSDESAIHRLDLQRALNPLFIALLDPQRSGAWCA